MDANYIIIRAEEKQVKIITKKKSNEENLEILDKGQVLILNLHDNIINFKIIGKARIVSKLDPVISE
ncbi:MULTISPECIES: trp RNA-binding attenuation protein MtrB [unclassified Gemella]|uniref:trp RNA-binding attenuation protein MtrB n=1 Tax=unclassified Gemella TaxID=2624949 RepID=UPI001073E470|nr:MULTISPECIES: trp RNA-binding attenuation protein MtrB [unclassified Gemella]MBF0710211.1 trp RNA-binding attenuation protein MtrB [Gemella sp. GL1.1]MBF0746511.1 trp RNA-binding attenuation protein MtrB [Gemella sp. 19428wG2_WT2a]NYS27555.1 trp RNA-binding attenuation protein MtrB [Gemella sp. GL1]TFU60289.1 trp RNA-binding attenuation protein MtrB [Gemella sp. WT2a]